MTLHGFENNSFYYAYRSFSAKLVTKILAIFITHVKYTE